MPLSHLHDHTIYDELIDLIKRAERDEREGHPVDALIELGNVRSRLVAYLHERAN